MVVKKNMEFFFVIEKCMLSFDIVILKFKKNGYFYVFCLNRTVLQNLLWFIGSNGFGRFNLVFLIQSGFFGFIPILIH